MAAKAKKKVASKATEEVKNEEATEEVKKEEWIEVTLPFLLNVAGKPYPPNVKHVVKKELAQTLLHMSELKRKSELNIHVGRKFEIEKLMTPTGYRRIEKVVGNVT